MAQIIEGYMPFRGYKTYYRSVGECKNGKKPLLLLHGGPGSTHNYFELLDELAEDGRQIISYDQLGCGNSFVEGHPELWTLETWIEELEALINHLQLKDIHILGHSWGGMMIISWLIEHKPCSVSSAILSSTLSSSKLWGSEQHRLISFMPQEHQEAIQKAEANNDWQNPEYLAANDFYTIRHACDIKGERPECLMRKKRFGTESYITAWGPNEYTPLGNLKDFDYTDRLKEIAQPCLIINGTNDESTPLLAKTMYDNIPDSEWELLDGARHLTFGDQPETYCTILRNWMEKHD